MPRLRGRESRDPAAQDDHFKWPFLFYREGFLDPKAKTAETGPGKITIEVPLILEFNDFNDRAITQPASSLGIGFRDQLITPTKSVVVLKGAVSFSESQPLTEG